MEDKKTIKLKYDIIIAVILFLTSYIFGAAKMGFSDINRLSLFSLVFLLCGLLVLPLTLKHMKGLWDGGLVTAKVLGTYGSGFLIWLLSSLHILPFNNITSVVCTIMIGVACYTFVLSDNDRRKSVLKDLKCIYKTLILAESLFYSMFVYITWYMCHKIPGHETERVMDLAFMRVIDSTSYMPPLDMWACNKNINYYYFGQYIVSFLGKLSFCKVDYSYTLGMYIVIPVLFFGVFSLVYAVCKDSFEGKKAKRNATIAGVISACGTTFAGNMHCAVFYKFVPALRDILRIEEDYPEYFFSNSTRYIGYVPENTADKTISEFPSYSYFIGDLHAHVVNAMVVIAVLSVLYAFIRNYSINKENETPGFALLSVIRNPYICAIGFFMGICSMANVWDFPIYFVVCGSVILFNNLRLYDYSKKSIWITFFEGLYIFVIEFVVSLPFSLKFDAMVNGIGIVGSRSYIHQLLIMWGYPVLMVVTYLFVVFAKKKLSLQEMYVSLIGLCAMGLVLIPELIYVKDIYESGFPRANTMFKLSYQAFILFGIVCGIVIVRLLAYRINTTTTKIGVIGVFCFLCCMGYFFVAGKQWIGDIKDEDKKYISMDASWKLNNVNASLLDSIEFLKSYVNEHEDHAPIVLEAYGDSYSDACPVSLYTGYPTVLGWQTHEWLWRNTYDFVSERADDVYDIYTSDDARYVKTLTDKYSIEYIYIGREEYERFEVVQNGVLESMGDVIYSSINNDGQLVEIIRLSGEQ